MSAGLLTVFMIIGVIKFTLDTIRHGYALHSLYGWSVHILGAFWNSLTQLLLQLGQEGQQQKKTTAEFEPSAPSIAEAPFTCTTQKYQVECQGSENNSIKNSGVSENKLYPALNQDTVLSRPPCNPIN